MSKIFQIFPTTVMKFQRSISSVEFNEIELENKTKNYSNDISENMYILEKDSYAEIKKFILDSLEEYIEIIYKPKNSIKPVITESWINYNHKGDKHHIHKHPNSFTSGVYYIQCLERDFIRYYKEKHHYIEIETTKYDAYNAEAEDFRVSAGDLLLFPSDLAHSVEENPTDVPRISLSFNTFLKGNISSLRSRQLML